VLAIEFFVIPSDPPHGFGRQRMIAVEKIVLDADELLVGRPMLGLSGISLT